MEKVLEKLSNKDFAFRCIDLLDEHNVLEKSINVLTNKDLCSRYFRCSGFPVLSEVSYYGEPTRNDCYQGSRQRYYMEKIVCGKRAFVLTNHWYGPNKSMPDNRTPFQRWVLNQIGK